MRVKGLTGALSKRSFAGMTFALADVCGADSYRHAHVRWLGGGTIKARPRY